MTRSCRRIVCLAVAGCVLGGTGVGADQVNGPPEGTAETLGFAGHHIPEPSRTFEPGPPIRPRATLMEWLDPHGYRGRRVKLPLVLHFDEHHMGIIKAFIGASDTVDAETIFLRVDDSWMGISLMDRLDKPCPRANPTCMIWVEGYWGKGKPAGIPLPMWDQSGVDRREWPFMVMRVHERVEEGLDGASVHAQVEVEP